MLRLRIGVPVRHGSRGVVADAADSGTGAAGARSGRRALIVAAALAAGPAWVAGPAVRVVAPDGLVDRTARVACLEPSSDPVAIDALGNAMLPAACARAQCTSRRWLAGDVVEGTCHLAPAVVLDVEMPVAARGEFAVRLEPKGGRGTPIDATMTLAEGSSRSPLSLPPVAPGSYVLSVHRAGSA